MPTERVVRVYLLLLAVLPGTASVWAGGGTPSAQPQAVAQDAERKRLVENKLSLLDSMVNRSPAVPRIDASDNRHAKELLSQARQSWSQAAARLREGDTAAAETYADDGLRAFSGASRLVVNAEAAVQAGRERNRDLRQRLSSFREAFDRIASEKGPQTAQMLDRNKVDALVAQAERLAGGGDYDNANRRLIEASALLEVALTEARNRETLMHELRFETPAEEYGYEQQRNHAYVMLIDLLQKQQPPDASARPVIEQMVRLNEALRTEATRLAAGGDFAGAIKRLEEGSGYLTRALRRGGMAIP